MPPPQVRFRPPGSQPAMPNPPNVEPIRSQTCISRTSGCTGVPVTIDYSCSGACGQAGSLITARVETKVSLPGFPLLFGSKYSPHITLRANHTDVVATAGEG